jgi:diadenosine tetraphosphate (Ap4A) HIT family hydrolase
MLQTGSAALLEAFTPYKVERVRRPPGASSYAFLEFSSHELAKECLEKLGGETVVAGIHLTLKWATTNPGKRNSDPQVKKRRLTEAEAMDSCTIYFRLPPKVLSAEFAQATEDLRVVMESSLEKALADPDVTAATEPALQVKARPADDKNYGFLEFASHAAASMALATMTGSTDGGLMIDEATVPPMLLGLALHWAHDAKPPPEEGGLHFQRKPFPPDSRKDCWFCLASPTCEKHLIVSVHDECYIAMPKGPVHPEGHVLIVPVNHSGKGALMNRSVAAEMEDLKQRLRKHASDVWQMDLFVFERAIQTKGGYHTHVQCIPIKRGLGIKLQATMVAMARSIPSFDLRELNSDLALGAMTNDEDDGGYFYAEVPISRKENKRFLHKAKVEEGQRGAVVPLQFGREVLASVLDEPNLAHWKACVLDQEKETELANAFRETFAKSEEP